MKRYFVLFCLIIACVFGQMPFLEAGVIRPFLQKKPSGQVNWYSGEMIAVAEVQNASVNNLAQKNGLLMRKALINSRQNLWDLFTNIRIDNIRLVKEILNKNPDLENKIRGVVHNAQIIEKGFNSEGRLKVKVGLNFRELVIKEIIPQSVWYETLSSNSKRFDQAKKEKNIQPEQTAYTGLIIDAKGLHLSPSILFTIYDPSGKQIYYPGSVDPDLIEDRGLAVYLSDIKSAVSISRTGKRPLVVQAQELRDNSKVDLILSKQQSTKILNAPGSKEFLKKCRVAIVLDNYDSQGIIEYSIDPGNED